MPNSENERFLASALALMARTPLLQRFPLIDRIGGPEIFTRQHVFWSMVCLLANADDVIRMLHPRRDRKWEALRQDAREKALILLDWPEVLRSILELAASGELRPELQAETDAFSETVIRINRITDTRKPKQANQSPTRNVTPYRSRKRAG